MFMRVNSQCAHQLRPPPADGMAGSARSGCVRVLGIGSPRRGALSLVHSRAIVKLDAPTTIDVVEAPMPDVAYHAIIVIVLLSGLVVAARSPKGT
jgi:hypothetical protein